MSKSYQELISWLEERGALDAKFDDDSLLDHLEGVYKILKRNKKTETVCLAGLFYSIYDPISFTGDCMPLSEREVVRGLIGSEAEHLVWLCGQLDRVSAYMQFSENPAIEKLPLEDGTEMALSANQLGASMPSLLTIACAVLLERQQLWRNQWLVPHAKEYGFLMAEGDEPNHALVEAHVGQMLAQAKQALTLELIEGINFQRKGLASSYWWGDELRLMKAKQAKLVQQTQGQVDASFDIKLVKHYATVNGLTLLAAAQSILARAEAFEAKLIETEMLKDSLMADIHAAQNFEDIERVRAVLDEKA